MAEPKTPEPHEQEEETPEETPSKAPAKGKGGKRAPAKKKTKKAETPTPWWQGLTHRRRSHLRNEE